MKKFILKSIVFFALVIGILSFILVIYGGYIDYFYQKFTTPKAKSMIFGDSRSMQGIQPSIINNYFKNSEIDLPMFNYSFTIAQIAYGPLYTKSIMKKLDPTANNGLYIVTVNPWILSERENDNVKKNVFFESGMPPYNMECIDMNPNFEYLIKNYNYFHFRSIIRQTSKMHKDGWLEESNLPEDTITLNKWKSKQIRLYTDYSTKWKKSEFRLNSLKKLINILSEHGKVVLVRMPIDKNLIKIENKFWPNFNYDLDHLIENKKAIYIDFNGSPNNYRTYDGNHLDKYGGKDFTNELCDSIASNYNLN